MDLLLINLFLNTTLIHYKLKDPVTNVINLLKEFK